MIQGHFPGAGTTGGTSRHLHRVEEVIDEGLPYVLVKYNRRKRCVGDSSEQLSTL